MTARLFSIVPPVAFSLFFFSRCHSPDRQAEDASRFTYQDICDDRVMTYFDLSSNARKVFTVPLNATYSGRFYLPAVHCEVMYDHTIHARNTGQRVDVSPRS